MILFVFIIIREKCAREPGKISISTKWLTFFTSFKTNDRGKKYRRINCFLSREIQSHFCHWKRVPKLTIFHSTQKPMAQLWNKEKANHEFGSFIFSMCLIVLFFQWISISTNNINININFLLGICTGKWNGCMLLLAPVQLPLSKGNCKQFWICFTFQVYHKQNVKWKFLTFM